MKSILQNQLTIQQTCEAAPVPSTKRGQGSQTLSPIWAQGFVAERRCNFAESIHAPIESEKERERERDGHTGTDTTAYNSDRKIPDPALRKFDFSVFLIFSSELAFRSRLLSQCIAV